MKIQKLGLFKKKKKTLALQMKDYHSRSVIPMFLIGLYFNKTLKNCSFIFYQSFLHLMFEGLYAPFIVYILKYLFCVKTQNTRHDYVMVLVMVPQH
jgi:hypothetical protein